jgi:putative ABC transport system permease protein
MEKLLREVKFGTRSLARSKGFAAAVVVTLSACIAVNVAIFAIVNSVLLRPLPIPKAQDMVLMSNEYPKAGVVNIDQSSSGDYFDRMAKVTALGEQAAFRSADQTITISGTPQRVVGMIATPSLFRLLQITPSLGRTFTDAEGEIGGEQKVILSYGLWQQLYGGNAQALGSELRLSGRPFTVVGVMPRNFVFIDPEVRLWIPAAFTAEDKTVHHSNNWHHIGRLKPGATIQQVQAQMDALNAENLERFPQMKQVLIDAGFHSIAQPLEEMVVRDVKSILHLLWAGSLFVLLIGVLNIGNLALARFSLRKKELATRLALGAGRVQLMRQFLVENLLLAAVGCAAGVLVGDALLRIVRMMGLNHFPRAYEVRIDGEVLAVAVLLALSAGVLISMLSLIGFSKNAFNDILRESERTGSVGKGTRRVRQGLVVAQVGFAFSLLVGAGLLLASFRELLKVDPGFRTNGIVTASVSIPSTKYTEPNQKNSLLSRSLEIVRQTPGVISAGATTTIPLGGDYNDSVIMAEGYVMKPGESVVSPRQISVTPGYLETMGISLVRGRYFAESDTRSSPLVMIIDESLAKRFWPGRDPVGQRMYEPDTADVTKIGPNTIWYRIVGVVRPVRLEDLSGRGNPSGAYYFPLTQRGFDNYTLAVRTGGDSEGMVQTIRREMAEVDPDLPLFDVRTMAQREELSLAPRRTSMLLALGFGGLALFLAAIGIFGVLSYLVAQRSREIGIRVALGSTQSGIVKLVLREGLVLVGIGLVLGIAGSISLRSIVISEIYGVGPLDPWVLGSVAAVFGVVALSACVAPARRAVRVDPVVVLTEQ